MTSRIAITALIYLMVQAVLFGVGAVLVLATPLSASAMQLMPWVVVLSFAFALPFSWWLAPRLRARYWKHKKELLGADRLIAKLS
jgi:hypothetical protein